MYEAMNTLGIKSHHMKEVFYNPQKQIPLWTKAYSTEGLSPVEWDEVLEGYESVQDVPACQFVKELAVLNPDAKVSRIRELMPRVVQFPISRCLALMSIVFRSPRSSSSLSTTSDPDHNHYQRSKSLGKFTPQRENGSATSPGFSSC